METDIFLYQQTMQLVGCLTKPFHRNRSALRLIRHKTSDSDISGLISSSPAAFPDFIPLIAVVTSAAMKTSSSPECITFCVLRVDFSISFY